MLKDPNLIMSLHVEVPFTVLHCIMAALRCCPLLPRPQASARKLFSNRHEEKAKFLALKTHSLCTAEEILSEATISSQPSHRRHFQTTLMGSEVQALSAVLDLLEKVKILFHLH